MRILDTNKIAYETREYKHDYENFSGQHIAEILSEDPSYVYKTLVTETSQGEVFVFLVTVLQELDLKKASRVAGVKSLSMLAVKDLMKTCGYVRGGCSPIGMKSKFKTFIDKGVEGKDKIYISGGKRGCQIRLKSSDLIGLEDIQVADISKN